MSSPLAIAAVTAALKDLLNDGMIDHDLSSIGSFSITSLPPDRVTTGQQEPNQLNLFLYQVTPNLGWRNADLPSRDRNGVRVANAPLALDLHYMLSAYGSQDLNAEILLGYAMHVLHENPILTREQLRTVLGGTALVDGTILPSPFGDLSALDLADQVEPIKISPVYLTTDELSKMWTAMQARYRPTMAFLVSVVLIQATNPVRVAPPVLKRGPDDRGPVAVGAPFPALTAARPAISELLPAVRLGDDVLLTGTRLDATVPMTGIFENGKFNLQIEATPAAAPGRGLTLHIPSIAEDADAMHNWAVGVYSAALRVEAPNLPPWTTNGVPMALAPRITVTPLAAAAGNINLTVTCEPRLRKDQEAHTLLIFGRRTAAPATIDTPADPLQPTTLTFTIPNTVAGQYLVSLRIEGIESLPVLLTGSPAKLDLDPQQRVTVT